MKYQVKQTPDKKYIVVNELDQVANNFKHKTRKEADRHCMYLQAHFGGNK
jgi:hypothetical protein